MARYVMGSSFSIVCIHEAQYGRKIQGVSLDVPAEPGAGERPLLRSRSGGAAAGEEVSRHR
jgi:hypothetical protein